MKIRFTPIRSDERLTGHVDGEVVTLNGEEFDLSPLADGASLLLGAIDSKWVSGEVERRGGEIYITLASPHGHDAPYESRFPSFEYIDVDGDIPFPLYETVVGEAGGLES